MEERVVLLQQENRVNMSGGDHDPSNGQGNAGECDHCFCTPCRQACLGDGASATPRKKQRDPKN